MAQMLTTTQALQRIFELTGQRLEIWTLRRLYDRNLLPLPQRFGQNRVIAETDLPRIIEVARQAGYLRETEAVHA